MAEKKPFGQSIDDAIKSGILSIYENESAQALGKGLINNPLSKGIMQYVVDPVAELGTRAASAKGILPFLPDSSLLTLLTPEVTMDRQTRESIDEDLIPYKPRPEGMSIMDVMGIHMDRARADIGALGEFIFGDVRKAGENLNKGVKFADLPPEQKMASRFFLLDILPIPGVGPAAKAGAKATKELENLKSQMITSKTTTKSGGAADTIGEMTEQVKNIVGPISNEELAYLSNVFPIMLPQQRLVLKDALTNDEFDTLLEFTKDKIKPGFGTGNRKMSIVEQNGVPGIMYGRTKDKKRFVPLSNLNLKVRPKESKSAPGGFDFTLKEGEKITTRTDAQKEGLLGGQKALRDIEAAENAIIKELYPKLKAQGLKMGMTENPQPNTIFAIIRDRLGSDRVGNRLLSRKGFREKLQKLGLYEAADKSDDVTRQKLIEGVADLTDDKVKSVIPSTSKTKKSLGISDPFVRSLGEEFKSVSDVNNFLISVGVKDVKDLKKLTPDNPELYNLLENYRVEAQDFLNTNPQFQNYFKSLGETDNIVLHRAHSDRSISPSNQSQQFQGLDATNVKILGQNVNVILQPDLEVALYKKIKSKDVGGTKEIIDTMKDFFIGTKLNDPRRPNLTTDDYKWLQKNKIIKIPTISVGAGRPYKNTDAVIFGTEQQPNLAEIVGGELSAREYFKNKTAFEKKYGVKYVELLNEGGLVKPVKASTGGFFSRLFGKSKFREEGMDVSDIYNPTAAQRTKLEELYPGTAFPEKIDGQVYYSNLDTALRKQNAPQVFNTQKELTDYFNASGVGVDEVYDAKLDAYIKAKTDRGLPLLSSEMLQISNESPLRDVYFDAYGFRSDKYNKSYFNERSQRTETYKETNYDQGLNAGFVPNTYRERVLRIPFTALRGDPGKSPGVGSHTFGAGYGDQRDNYMIAWSRQTDRPAFILPGETVDAQSGKIVRPKSVADKTKLQNIENKIQKLGQDPIANLNIVDDVFDARDTQAVMTAVKDLVEKSNGRINNNRAMQIILGQAKEKKKQLKKLQTQYNDEAQRIDDFKPVKKQEVTATVVEELQSDLSQAATKKARDLALKLKVMADQNIPLESMKDNELLTYFQQTKDTGGYGVSRPVGASRLELQSQYDQLMDLQRELTALSRQRPYQMNAEQINFYRDQVKVKQTAIIDTMVEAISKDLMNQLYADVPLKNRLQWADAVFKQAVAEAWHRKFIEKDPNAPSFIGIQSGDNRRNMWNQSGSAATSVEDRAIDKASRVESFTNAVARGDDASLGGTQYPGVGTDEFYGGPLTVTPEGTHYTGVGESIMKKLANDYNSRVVILNSATSNPTSTNYFKIINQDTGADVGMGDTYRQAENIANDLVDKEGGRYKIERATEKVYDTEPIFGIELTPEMGQLFKIYK